MKKSSKVLAITTFLFAAISLILVIIRTPSEIVAYEHQIILCALAMLLTFVPSLIDKIFKISLHDFIKSFYFIYLISGILLGNIFNFYYLFPFWDKLLHLLSGFLLMLVAFIVVEIYTAKGIIKLNKVFTVIFALMFALSIGVIWEFFEYTIDLILDVNMQRYMLKDKTLLVGQAALHDTMQDMLLAALGAVICGIIYFFKKNKNQD